MLNRSANQAWRRLTVTAVYLIPEELGPKHPSEAFTIMSSSGMDDGTGGGVAPPSGSYVETLQAPSSGGEDSQVVGPEGSETPATIADASAASHSVDGLGTSSSEDAGTSSYDGDQNVLDEPVSATPERNQPPANMTDDELRDLFANGNPNIGMPPVNLTDSEFLDVVAYLRVTYGGGQ